MKPPLPTIAVAEGAFALIADLGEHFAGRAHLRVGAVATPGDVAQLTDGASALVVTLQPLRAEHVAALADTVEVIVRAGVGLDTIDLEAARERGIRVVFQPDYATNEVADHAAALALAAWRRLKTADAIVREEGWISAAQLGAVHALHEATLGVIGTGRIGRAFIQRLAPFVRRIVAFDACSDESPEGVEWVDSAADVFANANLLSLHVPLTPQTRHLIDADVISSMPGRAVIVNVSRGGLVDERALANALESGWLAAAALDVFEDEPLAPSSPLWTAPNLLITPHVAWYSVESGARLAMWSLTDAVGYVTGGDVVHGTHAWI